MGCRCLTREVMTGALTASVRRHQRAASLSEPAGPNRCGPRPLAGLGFPPRPGAQATRPVGDQRHRHRRAPERLARCRASARERPLRRRCPEPTGGTPGAHHAGLDQREETLTFDGTEYEIVWSRHWVGKIEGVDPVSQPSLNATAGELELVCLDVSSWMVSSRGSDRRATPNGTSGRSSRRPAWLQA